MVFNETDQKDNDSILLNACWDQEKFFNRMSHNMPIIKQLIQLFLEDNATIVSKMALAIDEEDTNTFLALAHKTKGSAKNLSFNAVADILQALELSVKTNGFANIAPLFQKFSVEYNKLIDVLNEYLQLNRSN